LAGRTATRSPKDLKTRIKVLLNEYVQQGKLGSEDLRFLPILPRQPRSIGCVRAAGEDPLPAEEGCKREIPERIKPQIRPIPQIDVVPLPIDRSKWEQGKETETTETQILAFLKSQPGRAFSLNEIVDGVRGLGRLFHGELVRIFFGGLPEELYFRRALENLVGEGEVKARGVIGSLGDSIYYIVA
jgi:hypothetical protein